MISNTIVFRERPRTVPLASPPSVGRTQHTATAGLRNRRQCSLRARASRAVDASVAPGEVVELEHVEGTHRSDLRLRDALLEMCCLAEPER